jgi:hypothetical protein
MTAAASACPARVVARFAPARIVARFASMSVAGPRPTKAILVRMLAAGSSWGLMLAGGLVLLRFRACGMVCIDDAMWTTAAALLAGNLVFAPAVMLGGDIRISLKHKP